LAINSKWVFDENTSVCSCANMNVDLRLARLKNPNTHKEQLRIEIIQDGKDSGIFVCSPMDIEGGLQTLREYGVMIQRVDKMDIRKLIDENYTKINILSLGKEESMEEYVKECFEYICQYISVELEKEDSPVFYKDELDTYNIPIGAFNKMMSGNTYEAGNDYFRMRFAQLDYTLFDKGRTAKTVRIDEDGKSGKSEKCISFRKSKVDEQLTVLGVSLPVTAATEN